VKKLKILLLITLSITLLSSCSPAATTGSYTISAQGMRSISLAQSSEFSVSRVVVLANGVAEIINSLGGNSILIGRDISSTIDSLEKIPVVTSGHQVLPEKIISLNPDLVIIDASTGPKTALDQIRSAGIKVVQTPESWSLTDIPKKIRAVGAAIGALSAAEQLIMKMDDSYNNTELSNRPRVAFLYLRGSSSIYLLGGPGSGADSLLEKIGAIDIGSRTQEKAFNTLTAEALATLNPEVILVMSKGLESVGGVSGLIKLPGVAQTKAGKEKKIIDVDDSLLLSFGPRTPALIEALSVAIKKVAP
jgi:iron complex transport system substrate-binding protein